MKRRLCLIVFLATLLGMFTLANAEVYVIGNGTSTTYYIPTYGYYDYTWSKTIYLASELSTAGMAADSEITGIGYYVGNTPANYEMLDQRIYMRHTSQTIYGTVTDETGTGYPNNANFNLVYSDNYTFNGGGWHYIYFPEPFVWNGTDNLEILYESWDTYGVSGYPTFRYTSTSTNYRGVYKYQDNTFPTTAGSRSYNRPNISFITPSTEPPLAAINPYPVDNSWGFLNTNLSWADGGGLPTMYNVYLGTTDPPDFIQSQTSTSFTPESLEPNTTYYWQIVPENANGPAEGCPVWTFKTPSETQLAESFEIAVPPAGWTNPGSWYRGTSYYKHGSAGAYKAGSTSSQYVLSGPRVTIDEASVLDFWSTGSSTTAILQVVYSEDRTTWTQIGENITHSTAYLMTHQSIDLSSLAGNQYYIGFRTGLASGTAYIDAVIGPEITPEIPGPVTLSSPADLATGINEKPTLSWAVPTTGGVPSGYYVYCDTNSDPSTLVATVSSLTYTFTTALDFSTTYYWKVVAYNGAGEAEGNPIRSFTVRDDPTLYPPIVQDFSTVPPTNWSRYSGLLSDPISLTTTTSGWTADGFANSGTTGSARVNIFGTSCKYWLVTPPINLGSGKATYNLEFNLALTDYGTTGAPDLTGTDDKFAVVISTDGGNTWNTANTLRLWDNAGSAYVYNNISQTNELVSLSLAGYSGLIAIGFYGESTVSNADNDLFIDNFSILQAGQPPTAPTTGIPANGATNVSALTDISWSGSTGSPTGYQLYLGTNPESISMISDQAGSSYNPEENLAYGTTYYWRVDPYNEYGTTTGTLWSFSTEPDPTIYSENLPYSQNFDGVTAPALPMDWSKVVSSTSVTAVVQTYTSSTPHTTPNHAYLYTSGDASATLILVSPPIDPALSTLRIKFWAKASTANPLLLGTLDNSNVFTLFQTINVTATYTEYQIDFSSYEGSDQRIGFKHGGGSTYRSIYVDDFLLEAIPTTPVFGVTPSSKDFGTVAVGTSISQIFTISNTGMGNLGVSSVNLNGPDSSQFMLADSNSYPLNLSTGQSATVSVSLQPNMEGNFSANLEIVDNLGKAIHNLALTGAGSDTPNAGGGDASSTAGGYYFANNVSISAPSQPSFSWVTQTSNAVPETPTSGTLDDGYWTVPIGFEFLYYGNVYSTVNICTNGFISFGTGVTTYTNTAIPAVAVPNNAIYMFWDDLEYYPGSSHIYYGGSTTSFVVTYSNMGRTGSSYNPDASVTAQVILFADGRIQISYLDITGTSTTHTPTIGIENADGSKGIQYHYNGVGGPYSTGAKGGGITIAFGENPNTLPVELSSFTATITSDLAVKIAWIAQSETNHSGYNVLRAEANDLTSAIKINPSLIDNGTPLGTQISYSYTDVEAYSNMVYYYWLESVSLDGISEFYGPLSITIGDPSQEPLPPVIPMVTKLMNAFPNPFNPNTNIRYSLKEAGRVNISIYNVKGQLVKYYHNEHANPGYYQVSWDGKDQNGQPVSSGIYMYRMTSGKYNEAKKMILAK